MAGSGKRRAESGSQKWCESRWVLPGHVSHVLLLSRQRALAWREIAGTMGALVSYPFHTVCWWEFGVSLVVEFPGLPLDTSEDGVIRVVGTRVTLETVVTAFQQGATAEEIVQQYGTLQLADVYAVIAFYLQRKEQVEEYVRQARKQAAEVQQENEARFDPVGIRARLRARRGSKPEE